ncbi:MAG: thiazole synthase [Phycisphaeraceae bacterium]|nr:thiazole synthase [Phycisphaeraceae bacterium]
MPSNPLHHPSAATTPPTAVKTDGRSAVAGELSDSPLTVGGRPFTSRLILGTGKYRDYPTMQRALDVSGTQIVTVAVRRERLFNEKGESLLSFLDTKRYAILPNTAGCFSADDAVRVARLGREILEQLGNPGAEWVKLEVLGDKETLLPDPMGTIEATRELARDGFKVFAYTSDDPIAAIRIKEAGATSVMPAGSPIGSGQGVLNRNNVVLCLELLKQGDPSYPVIVDAGVGSASDVAVAMELGADGVLLNTAVAHATDPVRMADAMRHACVAGRQGYLAGRIPKRLYASASSPWEGVISYIPGE